MRFALTADADTNTGDPPGDPGSETRSGTATVVG
jgi:hypothetical protein